MTKPPPVRTGRGFVNLYISIPLRCKQAHAYYYDYKSYDDVKQRDSDVMHEYLNFRFLLKS